MVILREPIVFVFVFVFVPRDDFVFFLLYVFGLGNISKLLTNGKRDNL